MALSRQSGNSGLVLGQSLDHTEQLLSMLLLCLFYFELPLQVLAVLNHPDDFSLAVRELPVYLGDLALLGRPELPVEFAQGVQQLLLLLTRHWV